MKTNIAGLSRKIPGEDFPIAGFSFYLSRPTLNGLVCGVCPRKGICSPNLRTVTAHSRRCVRSARVRMCASQKLPNWPLLYILSSRLFFSELVLLISAFSCLFTRQMHYVRNY